MSTSVGNVVVHVSDVDRALVFYRDGLGLAVRFDSGDQSDPQMLALSGTAAGTFIRLVVLGVDGSAGLTLSSMNSSDPAPPPRFELAGFIHLGLRVDDIDAVLRRARKHGGTPFGTSGTVGPPGRRSTLAFLRDPDGSVIELVQPVAPPSNEPIDEPANRPADQRKDSR